MSSRMVQKVGRARNGRRYGKDGPADASAPKRQTRKICGETNKFMESMVAEATYGCRTRPAEFLHHTGVMSARIRAEARYRVHRLLEGRQHTVLVFLRHQPDSLCPS